VVADLRAGRILKGEKPADFSDPAEDQFRAVINMQTAKKLGLEIRSRLLARADEVIE
jgi:putative ABC transport system substrate-binding protein